MTHTATRDFCLIGDGGHTFAYGDVRYTYTITAGPDGQTEVEITQIEVSLAPGNYWMKAEGLLWDFLREVPDAWFIEQLAEAEE